MSQSEFLRENYSWLYKDLIENYSDEEIDNMSRREILEGYLNWHGIIGYTDDIVSCFEALFSMDKTNQIFNYLCECDFDCMLDGSFL
jgi:hypothetical protein